MHGGKAIGNGGYGCVVTSLNCHTQKKRRKKYVSKLMTKKYAHDEYHEITKIRDKLRVIPNYANYFVLEGVDMCKPAPLTRSDLKGFKKCRALTKKNYTAKNINHKLDELRILNLPDAGKPVKSVSGLADLLKNAIVPMNKLGVFHGDIKDKNVLSKHSRWNSASARKRASATSPRHGGQPKIIDWGLAMVHDIGRGIPKKLNRRPLQYNVPFSVVLLNDTFLDMWRLRQSDVAACHASGETSAAPNRRVARVSTGIGTRDFVVKFLKKWNKIRGVGHLKRIRQIFGKDEVIVTYLTNIIDKFVHDGTHEELTRVSDLFLKNVDIWGLVMTYTSVLGHKKMQPIIKRFLLDDPCVSIDVDRLYIELKQFD